MPYEYREEEKAKWDKETWLLKKKIDGETKSVETPIDDIPLPHVKRIVEYVKRTRNAKYKEMYVENSPLWLALNRRAGTNPADMQYVKPQPTTPTNPTAPTATVDPELADKTAVWELNKKTIIELLEDEIKLINTNQTSMDEVKTFMQALEIKLNNLL